MKRLTFVLVIGLLGGLFLSAQAQDAMVFALVPKAMNNPFFDLARDGCNLADDELDDVECLYIGPGEHTELEQVQIVQDLITSGRVDGIAVSPSNSPAIARVAEQAAAAGIPIITWDSDFVVEDFEDRIAYVGTKNYDIGVNLAKVVQGIKPDGGTICIQSGGAAAANHNERMQGIRDTLAGVSGTTPPGERLTGQNGWNEIDGCPLFTDDDFPLSVQQMDDILSANPDLDAFVPTGGFPQFVPNAYQQVAEKVKDRIDSQDLALVVADTLDVQIDFLKAGLSLGQVGQRPFAMGYNAMYILRDILNGVDVHEINFTGLDVCTPDNADTCVSTSTEITNP
ncbi:MAG: sugar-binding protein [Trueperaceae bacterium]|nr:MAG: sugar-binding protein [Trueperaceae bacterium]